MHVFLEILERSKDINLKDNKAWTPLHWAAKEGYLKLTKFIIENAEDKNPKNKFGKTPLHGDLKICQMIMAKVEDKNPKDYKGFTPLHYAAHKGHIMPIDPVIC